MVVNGGSPLASRWPLSDPEPSYRGEVHLEPRAASPPSDAVRTDGSIKADGRAAAVQLASQTQLLSAAKQPQSSIQCELVALTLKQAADGAAVKYLTRHGTQKLCRSTMRRARGSCIRFTHAVSWGWREQHRTTGAARHTWLSQLYPDGVEIDWRASNYLFRPPTVGGGKFACCATATVEMDRASVRRCSRHTLSVGRHEVSVIASVPLLPGARGR